MVGLDDLKEDHAMCWIAMGAGRPHSPSHHSSQIHADLCRDCGSSVVSFWCCVSIVHGL